MNYIIISRCPESNCFLIPEINLIYKNEKDYIQYKCKKGHNGEILLNDYLIKSKSKQLDSILLIITIIIIMIIIMQMNIVLNVINLFVINVN